MFSDYIDWRAEHPSDGLMTDMLNVEFEDETGTFAGSPARRLCSFGYGVVMVRGVTEEKTPLRQPSARDPQ
jgi:hypothetical protein